MLKRKIEQHLNAWKNTTNHKPVILKGCRQCGKTTSALDFAKKNYKNVVYLNFFENPNYASAFSGSLEIDNIVMMLSALESKAVFETGETVRILDEIQDCPQAHPEKYHVSSAIKLGDYNVGRSNQILTLRSYMAFLLNEY